MTRLDRLQECAGAAQDALGEILPALSHGRCPQEEQVLLCASSLRMVAAMLEGALTLPIEDAETVRRGDVSTLKREHQAGDGEKDFWWKKD